MNIMKDKLKESITLSFMIQEHSEHQRKRHVKLMFE